MILLTKYLGGHTGVVECMQYKKEVKWPGQERQRPRLGAREDEDERACTAGGEGGGSRTALRPRSSSLSLHIVLSPSLWPFPQILFAVYLP